jgi:hypothetical protein
MIHDNSMSSYDELDGLNRRCRAVISALSDLGRATDRRIKDYLNLPDMNNVRPRVTELLKIGVLEECGNQLCHVSNRNVRLVRLRNPDTNQMEMF